MNGWLSWVPDLCYEFAALKERGREGERDLRIMVANHKKQQF
jgi:hypothetical protein